MARGNDGSSGNFIDLGDITAARFERAETWTALAFFNLSASTPDDSAFITKYASGVSQFLFRTDNQAAPTNVEDLCIYRWFLAFAQYTCSGLIA